MKLDALKTPVNGLNVNVLVKIIQLEHLLAQYARRTLRTITRMGDVPHRKMVVGVNRARVRRQ